MAACTTRLELVAPDGGRQRASDVRTEQISSHSRPGGHIGVSGGWGGDLFTWIGFPFPIGGLFRNPTFRTRALVRVSDPVRYRSDPGRWKVAVVMGYRHGRPKTIERPAPGLR